MDGTLVMGAVQDGGWKVEDCAAGTSLVPRILGYETRSDVVHRIGRRRLYYLLLLSHFTLVSDGANT